MRKALKNIVGRQRFRGKFVRTGTASKGRFGQFGVKETLLLEEVSLVATNELVTDHLWFNMTMGFEGECLSPGDYVEFDARVHIYEKGYRGGGIDYQLFRPTKVHYVPPPDTPPRRPPSGVTPRHSEEGSDGPKEPEIGVEALAKRLSVKPQWLRKAEKRGQIPRPRRADGNYGIRLWKVADIEEIRRGLVEHGIPSESGIGGNC